MRRGERQTERASVVNIDTQKEVHEHTVFDTTTNTHVTFFTVPQVFPDEVFTALNEAIVATVSRVGNPKRRCIVVRRLFESPNGQMFSCHRPNGAWLMAGDQAAADKRRHIMDGLTKVPSAEDQRRNAREFLKGLSRKSNFITREEHEKKQEMERARLENAAAEKAMAQSGVGWGDW